MNGRLKAGQRQLSAISYQLSAGNGGQRGYSPTAHRSSLSPRKLSGQVAHRPAAFTLLELLTSIAVLAIISSLLFAAFNQATKVWLQGENRVETFTQARATLDFMTKESPKPSSPTTSRSPLLQIALPSSRLPVPTQRMAWNSWK